MKHALLFLLMTVGLSAAAYKPPRTSYGDPDLQGFWSNASLTTLERPHYASASVLSPEEASKIQERVTKVRLLDQDDYYRVRNTKSEFKSLLGVNRGWIEPAETFAVINGQIRSSWIVDPPTGKIPYLPKTLSELGSKLPKRSSYFNMETIPLGDRCLMGFGRPAGPPMLNEIYNSAYQIAQSPGHVAIWVENVHDVRIIRLNAPRLPRKMRQWMGDSIGRWDGDTLIVETINMNPKQSLTRSTQGKIFTSPDSKITERFTRISETQILYQFEIDDPKVYEKTWKAEMVFNSITGPVMEYACHEGNRSLVHQMEGARLPGLDPDEVMLVKEEP